MEAFLLYSKKSHIKRPVIQQHTVIVISNLRVSAIAIMESFFSLIYIYDYSKKDPERQ